MRGPSTPRGVRPFTTDAYPEHVTPKDALIIGQTLLGALAAMHSLGHESPAGMRDYINPDDMPSWHGRFVLDMVAGAQGFPSDAKNEALDRLHGFAWQSGLMHNMADVIATVEP